MVPIYNEEGNLEELVQRIGKNLERYKYEIVVVDDHSTDGSVSLLEKLASQYPIRIHTKEGHRGKAYSLLEGFSVAQYGVIAMIDGDYSIRLKPSPQWPILSWVTMLT